MNIAVGITLYNYTAEMAQQIARSASLFGKVFVYDNSTKRIDNDILNILRRIENISYMGHKGNRGLARALNVICRAAIKDGYQWILLLDQDDIVDEEMLNRLVEYVEKSDTDTLAIVSPFIYEANERNPIKKTICKKEVVITSGMLLKLKAFHEIGGFDEGIFLDMGDYEFCLRLRDAGYHIIQNRNAILKHNSHDFFQKCEGYKKDKYSAERYYYIIRDTLKTIQKYDSHKSFCDWQRDILPKRVYAMLMGDTHRIKKLMAIIWGYIDYKKNKQGKWKL